MHQGSSALYSSRVIPELVAFDLDDTLAPSKSRLPEEMARTIARLLDRTSVCVISGGQFGQFRAQVVEAVGGELEDEDYTGVVDHVLLWWRDGDGDLTDALVDTLGTLAEGSSIVLVTPRPGQAEEVDPSEVDEAATTAGLHTSGSVMCSEEWVATRLAAPKGAR